MNGGSEYKALHGPKNNLEETYRQSKLKKILSRNPELDADRISDVQKTWALGPNVAVLGHGSLKTTSFYASPFQNLVAQIEGEHDMARHLLQRTQQAIAVPVVEYA